MLSDNIYWRYELDECLYDDGPHIEAVVYSVASGLPLYLSCTRGSDYDHGHNTLSVIRTLCGVCVHVGSCS